MSVLMSDSELKEFAQVTTNIVEEIGNNLISEELEEFKSKAIWYATVEIPVSKERYTEFRDQFMETFIRKWIQAIDRVSTEYKKVAIKLGYDLTKDQIDYNLEMNQSNFPILSLKYEDNKLKMFIQKMVMETLFKGKNKVQIVLYRYNKVLTDTFKELYIEYEKEFKESSLFLCDKCEFLNGVSTQDQEYKIYSKDSIFEGFGYDVFGDYLEHLRTAPYNAQNVDILFRDYKDI